VIIGDVQYADTAPFKINCLPEEVQMFDAGMRMLHTADGTIPFRVSDRTHGASQPPSYE